MPRDAWAAARNKDTARRGISSRVAGKKARSLRRHANHITAKRLTSLDTVLWFGRYEGRSIRDLLRSDPSYLRWLASSPTKPDAWRMNILCKFLQALMKTRTP